MFVILAAATSCLPAADVQALRLEDQEKDMLSDSAFKYWQGVRWEVDTQAVMFITEDDRALFRSRIEEQRKSERLVETTICLLYTSPSPRDGTKSRMPSSA